MPPSVSEPVRELDRRWRPDAIALGLLVLAWAGFFWQRLFLPGVHVPKGGGDLASFLYPTYAFAASHLQQGHIPLWNPLLYSGSPFAADPQSGLYYPFNLVAFLVARPLTYPVMELLAMGHFLLASLFTYALARSLGLGPLPSWAGAVAFAYSGALVARLGNLNTLAASVWLPLLLLLLHRAVVTGRLRWAVVAGLALAVDVLAGHLQMTLMLVSFLGLYWVWCVAPHPRLRHPLSTYVERGAGGEAGHAIAGRRRLLTFPVMLAVAGGASAVVLLPAAELIPLSVRAEITYDKASQFQASPMGLINLVVPHFFGAEATDYWGVPGSLTEDYAYLGVSTLLLAGLSLVAGRRAGRWRWFLLLVALLALLVAVGQSTPLQGWLYRFVPGFDKVRAPGRFLLFFDLAIALLAAFGISALTRPLTVRLRPRFRALLLAAAVIWSAGAFVAAPILYSSLLTGQGLDAVLFGRIVRALDSLTFTLLIAGLAVACLVLWRWHRRGSHLPPLAAVFLVTLDIFSANAAFNSGAGSALGGFEHPEAIAFLKSQPNPYRIDSVTDVWDVWQPDLGLLAGVPDVMGIFNPLLLRRYEAYWSNLPSRSSPAYDLLNARYVVGHKDVALDWNKFAVAFAGDPAVNLYENRRVLPRAILVHQAEVVDDGEALRFLRKADFDPRALLLLADPLPPPANTAGGGALGRVDSVRHPSPNEVVVAGFAERPAYLFLADTHYPGWDAQVNGQPVPVARANVAFRAIVVPSGEFVAHFQFRPWSWRLGLAISLVTWALAASAFVAWLLRRRAWAR